MIGEALLRGTSRRDEFQSFLGVAPDLLDSRLAALVTSGILAMETDTEGVEHFVPTDKGRGLEVAIRALDQWSRDWDPLSSAELLGIVDVVAIHDGPEGGADSAGPTAVAEPSSPSIELCVLEHFDLQVDGHSIELSPGSQRLLVFLALRDRAIARIALAGTMWPDVSEGRAGDSLRSAIARLEEPARAAIRMSSTGLRLVETASIDLRDAQALAHRLLQTGEPVDSDVSSASIPTLSRELLPAWYDDWVLGEAEDWRYLRMNALESLARRLLGAGLLAEAAAAARAVMRIDPLRESPQTSLVRAQLAMGNRAAAIETFERFSTLLHSALGLAPSKQLADLVGVVTR